MNFAGDQTFHRFDGAQVGPDLKKRFESGLNIIVAHKDQSIKLGLFLKQQCLLKRIQMK